MSQPKFKHDCPQCTFQGHYLGHDVYICRKAGGIENPTILARFSDEEGDYGSYAVKLFLGVLWNGSMTYTDDNGVESDMPYQEYVMSKEPTGEFWANQAMVIALADMKLRELTAKP